MNSNYNNDLIKEICDNIKKSKFYLNRVKEELNDILKFLLKKHNIKGLEHA